MAALFLVVHSVSCGRPSSLVSRRGSLFERLPDDEWLEKNNERELLVSLLRIKGYQVDSVPDDESPITYLETHATPNVILMDMNMPGGDGASAVRRIRSDCHYRNARVFAISGTYPEEIWIGVWEFRS